MYIQKVLEMRYKLATRHAHKALIKRKRDEWVSREYGIENFSSIVEKHFEFLEQKSSATHAMLARQLPGICIEDVATALVSESLGLVPLAMSFLRDTFVSGNHDKLHRVKVPWMQWSKKGNPVIEYEHVAKMTCQELAGIPLSMIETKSGDMLPKFHQELRYKVFGNKSYVPDVSSLWNETLLVSRKKPAIVYQLTSYRETKVNKHSSLFEGDNLKTLRPPSEWYYPLYLSLFVTGEMVLLETYNNPKGGVPEAKILFEETMKTVYQGTGWEPLVIEIPPLSRDLLSCNRHLLEDGPAALEKLALPKNSNEDCSILELMNKTVDLVQKYGKPA